MTAAKKQAEHDVSALSFEKALSELETIVRKLEGGADDLENAIASYERGVALKKHCEEKLKEATAKVEKITLSPSGQAKTEPFDHE